MSTTSNTSKIFKDPHHVDIMFEKFHEEQQFLDVTLVAAIDQVKVRAHRLILSANSDYFMAMFSSCLKEASADEIELKEIDGTTLMSIVEFIYSGTIILHVDTIENIVKAADFLQMPELIAACSVYMSEHIDDSNCLGISMLAELFNYTELFEKALTFACKNFSEVCQEKEFLLLPAEQVMRLISSRDEDECDVDEETVFLSIADWFTHNKAEREKYLFDVLSLVKFKKLSAKFIIENRHSVCPLIECCELILSWIEWHLENSKPPPQPQPKPQPLPQLLQLPTPKAPNPLETRKRKRYIIALPGGTSTNDLMAKLYEAPKNVWTSISCPSPLVSKMNFGATIIYEQLIIAGGKNHISNSLNSVECFDLLGDKWFSLPPMQQPRHSCAVTELNGDLYVIGGYYRTLCLTSVEKYDFEKREWTFVEPLPEAMRIVNVAVLNNYIYAVDVSGNSMYCYDPSYDQWIRKTFKNEESRFFGLAAAYGYLFAFGGYIGGKPTDTVERYNPLDDDWDFLANLDENRCGMKCTVLNNRIIVCGGRTEDGLTNQVEEYNPRTDMWRSLAPMPMAMDGRAKVFSL